MKTHYAVIQDENGDAVQYPLKDWVRENINILPQGIIDGAITTHDFRRRLRRIGWNLQICQNEVFVIRPDSHGSFQYASGLIDEIIEEEEDYQVDRVTENEISLSLELDLQRSLRQNIGSLEPGLRIIDNGHERTPEAGRIDITASDPEGNVVIIELKAVEAKAEVIAQTLAYMRAVRTEDNVPVRGIIVASDFPKRVRLAAQEVPTLKLVRYGVQFRFTPI